MKTMQKTLLQRMDGLVGWTGISLKVALDMNDRLSERRYRPRRWLPLLPMVLGVVQVIAAVTSHGTFALFGMGGAIVALAAAIKANGPLGKPSIDDDEREAESRKSAWLFCLAILAGTNIAGQPMLMLIATLKAWKVMQVGSVAFAVLMCNLAWFACLPTLYASWIARRLSEE